MSSRTVHSIVHRHAASLGKQRGALTAHHRNHRCVCVSCSSLLHISRHFSSASPAWCYRPSVTSRPSRAAVLSTYRQLLHLVHRSANGEHQLWSQRREEQINRQAADAAAASQQANSTRSTAAAVSTSDGSSGNINLHRYNNNLYREHRHESDESRIAALHSSAVEYAALLHANLEHSREVYEAGWGQRQETKAHVANVARRVGLQVGKSKLEEEIEQEAQAEMEAEKRQQQQQQQHSATAGSGDMIRSDWVWQMEAAKRRKQQEEEKKRAAAADAGEAGQQRHQQQLQTADTQTVRN